MKKMLIAILMLLLVIGMFGCGTDKNSALTKEELSTLNKNYSDYTTDDIARIVSIPDHMNEYDWEKYGEKLKAYYIADSVDILGEKEGTKTGEMLYNSTKDEALAILRGEKPKESKAVDEDYQKVFQAKMNASDEIESKLKDSISTSEHAEIVNSISVETESEEVSITVDLNGDKDLTRGQISNLRNALCDIPIKYAEENGYEYKTIKVDLTISTARADSYIFTVGSGWDKDVE